MWAKIMDNLKALWVWYDGKKTLHGVVWIAVYGVTYAFLQVVFPSSLLDIEIFADKFGRAFGTGIQDLMNGTGAIPGAILLIVGLLHKAMKQNATKGTSPAETGESK